MKRFTFLEYIWVYVILKIISDLKLLFFSIALCFAMIFNTNQGNHITLPLVKWQVEIGTRNLLMVSPWTSSEFRGPILEFRIGIITCYTSVNGVLIGGEVSIDFDEV